jgi:trk system potassium uptake protein TrkH
MARSATFPAIIRLLCIITALVAALMLPSLLYAVFAGEAVMITAFALPMALAAVIAVPAVLLIRQRFSNMNPREGFLLVFLTWVAASLLGALPYCLSGEGISFTDAVFESTCGFATTGGTTIALVEALPASLLLWRATSHWAGGMGIVLLTVALLPLIGVGGFQLIKAETPGPEKEKLTPRVTSASKILWLAYVVLTMVLVLLYRAGGMTWFDAVCHGLTVMATGGVSTHSAGFAFWDSPFLDIITIIFMILAALNFNMYFRLLHGKFRDILHNTEGRVFLGILIAASVAAAVALLPVYGSFARALRYGAFQVVSIVTTTGTARVDYTTWPAAAQMILFCMMFVGGCSGSTAGGVKVIRHVVLFKQAGSEIRRVLYPQGVFSIHLNRKVGRKDVVYGVAGFVFLYLAVVAFTTLAGAAAGLDVFSAFSAALSVTGNVGVGFGAVGPSHNFAAFPSALKWLYSLVMIAGRLELWTVFVLFTPEYWR